MKLSYMEFWFCYFLLYYSYRTPPCYTETLLNIHEYINSNAGENCDNLRRLQAILIQNFILIRLDMVGQNITGSDLVPRRVTISDQISVRSGTGVACAMVTKYYNFHLYWTWFREVVCGIGEVSVYKCLYIKVILIAHKHLLNLTA